MLNNSQVEH